MSEPQTRFIDDTYVEYYNTGKHELTQIYLKSEADKVIARHKYKRCLAMAKLCENQRILCYMSIILHRYDFYVKWHKRWLELADKFKEAK